MSWPGPPPQSTGPEHGWAPFAPPPPPAPWPYAYPPVAWQRPPQNTVATVGLVCALAGVALLLMSFGFAWIVTLPLCIAGIVCGAVGRRKADAGEVVGGRGVAQAALIIGIVGVVLHLIVAVLFVIFWAAIVDSLNDLDTTPGHDLQPALMMLIWRV